MTTGGTTQANFDDAAEPSAAKPRERFIMMPAKRSERVTLVVMFTCFGLMLLGLSITVVLTGGGRPATYVGGSILTAGMLGFALWFAFGYRRGPWRSTLTIAPGGYAFRHFLRKDPRDSGKLKPWQPGTRLHVVNFLGTWTVRILQRRDAPLDGALASSGMQPSVTLKTSPIAVKLRAGLFRKVHRAEQIIDDALGNEAAVRETAAAISHCPECAYDLRGDLRARAADTTAGACPECGWQWAAGDIVLFGDTSYGTNPRRPGRRWNFNIIGPVVLVALVPQVILFGLLMLLIYTWRNLSPLVSTVVTASLVVFVLAVLAWSIMKVARLGESAKDKRDRLERERHMPAGQSVLRLTRDGFVQHLGLAKQTTLFDWDTDVGWKVQHWPGGVHLLARRKGWLLQRRPRPHVGFVVRTDDNRAAKRMLRRVVRDHLESAADSGSKRASV